MLGFLSASRRPLDRSRLFLLTGIVIVRAFLLMAVFIAVTGVALLLASILVVLVALVPREVFLDTVVWSGALGASLYYTGLVRWLWWLLLEATERGRALCL